MSNAFVIRTPSQDESVEADGDNQVLIRVCNNDIGVNTDFTATIVDIASGESTDEIFLVREGSTKFWSLQFVTDPVPDAEPQPGAANNNKTVTVTAFEGDNPTDSQTADFRASHKDPLAGSGGVVLSLSRHFKKFQAEVCRPDQPIPVAVMLKLDSRVTKGTCAKCAELNRPTRLQHTEDAGLVGRWYSRQVAFCGRTAAPGYWVLERNSATAWTLVLRQGDKVIVTFTAKTKPKDCSLPIKLQRKGAGGKACQGWPKTVTISAAP